MLWFGGPSTVACKSFKNLQQRFQAREACKLYALYCRKLQRHVFPYHPIKAPHLLSCEPGSTLPLFEPKGLWCSIILIVCFLASRPRNFQIPIGDIFLPLLLLRLHGTGALGFVCCSSLSALARHSATSMAVSIWEHVDGMMSLMHWTYTKATTNRSLLATAPEEFCFRIGVSYQAIRHVKQSQTLIKDLLMSRSMLQLTISDRCSIMWPCVNFTTENISN